MLQLKNVGLDHLSGKKSVSVLRRINLTLPAAGLVLVTGGSGSGKTALMHILSGRELPSRGEILIDGENASRWSDRRLSGWRRRVGSAEEDLLLSDRTISENAELSARLAGWSGADSRARAFSTLEMLGLKDLAERLPGELSGGERRQAALCCALARDPELLLVDEPADGLEEKTARQILSLLRAAARDRLVIAAARDVALFNGDQDRIVTLQEGEIVSITGESDSPESAPGQTPPALSPGGMLFAAVKNLLSRRGRVAPRLLGTFLAVLAASLCVSAIRGSRLFDAKLQAETLAAYPIVLTRESVPDGDLDTLGTYLETNMDVRGASLQRTFAITPRIYSYTASGEVKQVSPETENGSNLWTELPDGEALQRARYELVSGRWPARYDEAAVLLDAQGNVDSACLAALGLTGENGRGLSATDLLRLSFRVVLPTGEYVQNVDGTWGYMGTDREFMSAMVRASQPLNVVGILRPVQKGAGDTGAGGAVYTGDLTRWLINAIRSSEIVKAQMAEPGYDVLTHRPFNAAAHETDAAAQRSALEAAVRGLSPAEQAALYERVTGETVAETAAQDSLLQTIALLSEARIKELYVQEIESAVSPYSYEANLRAFGVREAETVTALRLYAGTFAYRGALGRLLNGYTQRVSYTDAAEGVVSAGASLLEGTERTYPALYILTGVLGVLGTALAAGLPLLPRRRETAVERALGMGGASAGSILVWEAFLLGLLGSAAGVLLAMVALRFTGGELTGGVRWELSWPMAGAVALAAVTISLLSARLAASGGAGSPEDALRRAAE
ncbi:MAG: ATP-binding cassette domain-containing protein [Oscillospiraceae bacterium]|nr:ATP-binding cassette domain-containing protein [Oscillospiraceae bacterium]